ncbi:MAG: endonuclease/exonuclease/phosphatase family protein, partial [Rubricoccaceae bacterium]|nr:endonuclease/exonuclease/phosphatase family protein [Rubricoccaceae bacterium]
GAGCASSTPDRAYVVEPGAPYFAVEPPPVWEAEGVRLATLNGEFLFDGVEEEGAASFAWKGDPDAARAHQEAVADVIRMLDADLVVVPETENLGVLETLIAGPLAGLGYTPYLVDGTDTFTGQDVGLLSRLPIEAVGRTDERVEVGLSDQTYGVSKNLWARLTLAGVPTTIIGVHFLAQPDNPERKDRREAQAEVIRRLVAREQAAGRAVAVLGDLNDFDDETLDRNGSRPITDVLARVKAAGPGPDDDLANVLADVPQRKRFTAFWDRDRDDAIEPGELSAIDHVLLSPELYRRVREVRYVHAHDPRRVTDHFPIVVTLGTD